MPLVQRIVRCHASVTSDPNSLAPARLLEVFTDVL